MPEILQDFSKTSAEFSAQIHFTPESQAGIVTDVTAGKDFSSSTECTNCGNTRINLVLMPEYCTHWAARRCGICDCFIGWQPKPENIAKRSQKQGLISRLLESAQLSHWEREFLQGLKGKRKLSPKQQEVLAKIEANLEGAL